MLLSDQLDNRELREALYVRLNSGLHTSPDELKRILQCGDKKKIHVVMSEVGQPIGYMAYALISKNTLYMLSSQNLDHLRDFEMDEGKIFYIMDMVINKDHARMAAYLLRQEVLKKRLVCGKKNGELKIYKRKNGKYRRVRLGVADITNNNFSVYRGKKKLVFV